MDIESNSSAMCSPDCSTKCWFVRAPVYGTCPGVDIRFGALNCQRNDGTKRTDGKRKLDRRSQAGLELEVVDAFTGRERDANTLSGGEGFQASLALALGLADVVQAQSGGIELSAMFIDEGFGTQSAEDLDSVLDTLVSLQNSGRLVGFISHVDGMKERISAKLVVTKTAQGSHARFVVQ